jgi:hypothetical protein
MNLSMTFGKQLYLSQKIFLSDLWFVHEQNGEILNYYCDSKLFSTIYLFQEMYVSVSNVQHICRHARLALSGTATAITEPLLSSQTDTYVTINMF